MTEIDKRLWPETCHGRWMSPEYEEGLVSVIIPTYNRAGMVMEAMDSVWAQTYRPIELIVVDDGSTDNTSEVLDQWAREHSGDPQFELRTFHQENKGAPAARNLGARKSKGEFIIWHDSDDLMLPQRVELPLARLRATGTDACLSGFAVGGQLCPWQVLPPAQIEWKLVRLKRLPAATFAWAYRRGFLLCVPPWREDLKCAQDRAFFNDWLPLTPRPTIVTVRRVLIHVRTESAFHVSDSRYSKADYETRLQVLREMLDRAPVDAVSDNFRRQWIAFDLWDYAIGTYLRYPGIHRQFVELARKHGADVPWGFNCLHRMLWRTGGIPACRVYLRLRSLIMPIRKKLTNVRACRHRIQEDAS